jgi:hypothetical protein
MLLMVPEMGPIDRSYWIEISVPAGVTRSEDVILGGVSCDASVYDADSTPWRWSRGPVPEVTGELSVKDATDATSEYAETLLGASEETYEPGCRAGLGLTRDDLLALEAWSNGKTTGENAERSADGFIAALRNCGR